MLKKLAYFFILLSICGVFVVWYFSENSYTKIVIIGASTLSIAFAFLGIAFIAIQTKQKIHYKLKSIFLFISLSLLVFSLFSKYMYWPGANLEAILAVFFYCFAYAPLELYLKHAKWRAFSSNKWEMLLLSSIDFIGINLILLGALTRVMHWPGQYNLIYTGGAILLAGLFLWNTRFKTEVVRRKKSEDIIREQYLQIQKEKQISETLLLNILPEEVAEELKAKGSAAAKQFDEVTVLFTDFKNFTQISETMTATELVEELNIFFKAFDHIITKLNIEKIKTIGDSYMCVGGLPSLSPSHAEDVVTAALEIQKFVENYSKERVANGKPAMRIRLGIHSGPVVAGIVGVKKYAYDIWGDTVNTASRMESSGETGKVNISQSTYELVKDKFICTPRGKIVAKHKGEMEMYFVEGLKD